MPCAKNRARGEPQTLFFCAYLPPLCDRAAYGFDQMRRASPVLLNRPRITRNAPYKTTHCHSSISRQPYVRNSAAPPCHPSVPRQPLATLLTQPPNLFAIASQPPTQPSTASNSSKCHPTQAQHIHNRPSTATLPIPNQHSIRCPDSRSPHRVLFSELCTPTCAESAVLV